MQERIEQYVRCELTSEQEDELWVKFLAEPEWYDDFDTWLHIVAIKQSLLNDNRSEVIE